MSGIDCLVDTNILILVQNGNNQIVNFIDGKNVFVSFITEIELLSKPGLTIAHQKQVNLMLDDCIILNYSEKIKDKTIQLRRKYGVKLPDAMIASTAIIFDLPLITCDKGFKKIKELDLVLIDI